MDYTESFCTIPLLGFYTDLFLPVTAPSPPKKLLDVVREVIRLKHYSYQTKQTHIN
jgi:hypothetical protein